ncbi:helix-turn-helix domain-containing protein [Methylobacterium sp. Leaf108]|uniref:MarR family transcriptional regulator n=1 Tax=Methylobacterium sp. Leaf108 TaxID=1736256 RepID=UPI0006F85C78|nr:helix-turn-helix domain-containing protein [Methylobacterium sp. Leaf108]KQP61040.1 hypothetical protein ASF39_15300 [Methylobacterium sp. Leaf108]
MSDIKLTPRERQVFEALSPTFARNSREIAKLAGIRTSSSSETAAHYCIRLVAKGLAEKRGTAMFPEWKLAAPPPSLCQGGA